MTTATLKPPTTAAAAAGDGALAGDGDCHTPAPVRDCDRLCCAAATLRCAVGPPKGCVPCAYKIGAFDVALDATFCQKVPNQRPELCPRSNAAAANDTSSSSSNSSRHNRFLGYKAGMKVLTVGDGDFSFSLSLARFGCHVTATSYETKETVFRVYHSVNIADTLAEMESLATTTTAGNGVAACHDAVAVAYGVDATNLKGTLPSALVNSKFQRIVWNFPCSAVAKGQDGQNQEMEENQRLVRQFIDCARHYCSGGEIHINHKTKPPFSQWKIDEVAVSAASNVRFLGRAVLDRHLFPPYVPRKALDRKSFPCHDACTYIFGVGTTHDSVEANTDDPLGAIVLPDVSELFSVTPSALVSVTPELIRALRNHFLQRVSFCRSERQTKRKRKQY